MLDFVCILTIFLEIFVVGLCCTKLIELQKRIDIINEKLAIKGEKIIEACKNIRNAIKKINKVVNVITNKRFWRIKKIIFMVVDTIQLIMFLKTLDFSKGIKSINYKTIKKLLLAQVSKEIIRKILTFGTSCA